MPGKILVVEDNLLFVPRIELALQASDYRPQLVTELTEFNQALKTAPVLVLLNLAAKAIPWPQMVEQVQARSIPPFPALVGYGPHVDLALRQRALDLGCDAVVGRSAVANNLLSLVRRHAWQPDLTACDATLPEGIREGIAQFNRHEFYACHDTIELVWVDTPEDVRLMYQGILQISVGFYHVGQGNWRGMQKMLARGEGKLLPFLPACQGVDLAGLMADVERAEAELEALGPERLEEFPAALFPKIRVADTG